MLLTVEGIRWEDGASVCVVEGDFRVPLDPRYDLRNHSPNGFNWGYGGSGPAQLALALAVELLGDRAGQEVYQDFKESYIAKLTADRWTVSYYRLREIAWDTLQRARSRCEQPL